MSWDFVMGIISILTIIGTLASFIRKKISRYKLYINVTFRTAINKDSIDVNEAISIRNVGNRTIYLEDMYCIPSEGNGIDFPVPNDMKRQLNVSLKPGDVQTIHSTKPCEWVSSENVFKEITSDKLEIIVVVEDSEERIYRSNNIFESVNEIQSYRDGLKNHFYFESNQ